MIAELEARPDAEPELEALGPEAVVEARPYADFELVALGPIVTLEQLE